MGKDIVIYEDYIQLESLLSNIEVEDLTFSLILDFPVQLQIGTMEKIGKERIELNYNPDSVILEVPLEAHEIKQQILYVDRLLGGREVFKDVDHLFGKLFKVYAAPISDMDLVHLEVLLSQCLRDKRDKSIPARLGRTWDPVMTNIKDIVFNTSFIQGLCFENVGKAIMTGLTLPERYEPSILEKVMTGTLVGEK